MAISVGRDAAGDSWREIAPMLRGTVHLKSIEGTLSPSAAIHGCVELSMRFSDRNRGRSDNQELALIERPEGGVGVSKVRRSLSAVLGVGTAYPVICAVMAFGRTNALA